MKQDNLLQSSSEGTTSPLDAIEIHFTQRASEEKVRALEKHLTELKKVVKTLSQIGLSPKERFAWPSASTYKTLDTAVDSILLLSGNRPNKKWSRYLTIDRKWPGLKLRKTIEELFTRVGRLPRRPFDHLLSLVPKSESTPELIEIIENLSMIRTGKMNPDEVEWERLCPIFLAYRSHQAKQILTILKSKIASFGTNERVAYIVYLEIDQEDSCWRMLHSTGLSDAIIWVLGLGNLPLWNRLKTLVGASEASRLRQDFIADAPARSRRELNKNAQRRHRAKK